MIRKTWKPVLFSLGVVAAGLIATNPRFVLPYKYHFFSQPVTVSTGELPAEAIPFETAEALPDGFSSVGEATPLEVAPSVSAATSATTNSVLPAAALDRVKSPTVWTAGNLSIPSLAITAPLIYVSEMSEHAFQKGLQHGVVQYPGTALPGQLGNMYVFGHSSDYRWAKGSYKTVFAKLPDIKLGSEIKITDGAAKVYTYKVISTVIALPSETKYLSQYNYQKKLLTVQTSYPVGTALKRFLAIAELLE